MTTSRQHPIALAGSRILVIGGAGFLGSHIVDQLTDSTAAEIVVLDNFVRGTRENLAKAVRDERVTIVDGTVLDRPLLRSLMDGTDYVFHLAALWLYECVNQPRAALDVNVVGTFNVAEAAVETKVRRLIYSSSASVYGDAVFTPMTEEHPFNNRTMYGATKIAGEQILRAFNEQSELEYVGLRYMNIYGPRMDDKGTYVSVIVKVLDRIARGERPIVFGDGSQTYDFVHVEDVARANILALTSGVSDVNLNIGTGVRTTVSELVALLLAETGSALEPEFRLDEAMFVTHRVGSTDLAERLIGFRAKVSLQEGVRSVVAWQQGTHAQSPADSSSQTRAS